MENLYTIYGRPDYLTNVSVDFRLFIDVNKAQKQFIIRDMYTEEEILKIPLYLMNYEKDPLEAILRIKWIGNEAIKIINDEGMEKIFEINASAGSEFKQLGYNQNCNFNYEIEKSRNFYIDRKELKSVDVTERLIRKC